MRTPDGLWRCDDDSGDGLNPALQIEQPTSGRYAIWVGTFASDAPPMDTMLHLGPTGTLLSEPKRPNLAIDPAFGSVELAFGFEPDPHTLNLSAGGTVNASSLGIDACVGFVSHGPAYGLNWTVADALSISVESNSDTTLLISDPSGAWSCNDDSEGLNPAIMFATPTSGRYNIWVGTFSEGAVAPAILRVTAIRRE